MSIMIITHNLGVVAQMTRRSSGHVSGQDCRKLADVDSIFYQPMHPYTSALINSIPRLGMKKQITRLSAIAGTVPDPYSIPKGCPFHTRCPFNDHDRCIKEAPALREITPAIRRPAIILVARVGGCRAGGCAQGLILPRINGRIAMRPYNM